MKHLFRVASTFTLITILLSGIPGNISTGQNVSAQRTGEVPKEAEVHQRQKEIKRLSEAIDDNSDTLNALVDKVVEKVKPKVIYKTRWKTSPAPPPDTVYLPCCIPDSNTVQHYDDYSDDTPQTPIIIHDTVIIEKPSKFFLSRWLKKRKN